MGKETKGKKQGRTGAPGAPLTMITATALTTSLFLMEMPRASAATGYKPSESQSVTPTATMNSAAVSESTGTMTAVPQITIVKTQVRVPKLSDVDAITADGKYLYIVHNPGGSRNQGAYVEDMSGHRFNVPQPDKTAPLLGTETNGVFVFLHVAGSAPVAYAWQPGKGRLQHFLDGDVFAHSIYSAYLSNAGHWISMRTNSGGAFGPGIYNWVDVDSTPVPMLQSASGFVWNASGSELGYVDDFGNGKVWLGVYDMKTHNVQLLGAPFAHAQRSTMTLNGWYATGFYSGAPSTQLVQWSSDGQSIAVQGQSPSGLYVYHVSSSNAMVASNKPSIPLASTDDLWGWLDAKTVYTVEGKSVSLYQDGAGGKQGVWGRVRTFTLPFTIDRAVPITGGKLLVSTTPGYLFETNGLRLTKLPVRVQAWWYDYANQSVYELPLQSSGIVYRVNFGA